MNRAGKTVLPPSFDDIRSFSCGVAWVKIGGKIGYIDKNGKYIWKLTPTKPE